LQLNILFIFYNIIIIYNDWKTINENNILFFLVLGKAITTLSRIGDELYVEPCKDGIYFRTVNAGRSAFASINFTHSFFSYYDLNASSIHLTTSNVPASNVANEDELLKCKVAMKVNIKQILIVKIYTINGLTMVC
jgi:hypothetical protein